MNRLARCPRKFAALPRRRTLVCPVWLLLLLALAACRQGEEKQPSPENGGTDGLPPWCDTRQHPRFPDSLYLSGVGLAEDPSRVKALDEAKAAAIADIASQFEVSIRSEVETYVRQSLQGTGDKTVQRFENSGSTSVRQIAEATFRFVEVGDQHYDPQTGTACALAVIDRRRHFEQIEKELKDSQSRLVQWQAEAEDLAARSQYFQALQRLRKTEALLLDRAALRAKAEFVLRPTTVSDPVSLDELYRRRRAVEDRISLEVVIEHVVEGAEAKTKDVEEALLASLQRSGFLFEVRSRTRELGAVGAEKLSTDFDRWPADAAAADRQIVALICRVQTRAYPVEQNFAAARSHGWLRVIQPSSRSLLHSVSLPPRRDDPCRRVGLASQRQSLATQSAACLADRLAEHFAAEF